MDKDQVQKLMDNCLLPDSCKNATLKETHISWIILTDSYAFKIKRPVSYSFLDFSSLAERKYYCHEEIELNSRMEPEMYLRVIPIRSNMLTKEKDESEGEIIDYAVQMKRMDNDKEMITLLNENKVKEWQIDKIATKIAEFHKKAQVVRDAFDTTDFQEKYADIESLLPYIGQIFGERKKDMVSHCIQRSHTYLNINRANFNERSIAGHRRDIHGDLNASNIFLYEDPVIFDCIEFNKEYRQIDVLNEIAFLCVDLEFYGRKDLSERLYENYCNIYGLDMSENRELITYYKSFRANVRAKVSLISAKENSGDNSPEVEAAAKYIDMMKDYIDNT